MSAINALALPVLALLIAGFIIYVAVNWLGGLHHLRRGELARKGQGSRIEFRGAGRRGRPQHQVRDAAVSAALLYSTARTGSAGPELL
jgi:hypothetical protein